MNLDQWFRRRYFVKIFCKDISCALASLLFGGAEPFMQCVEGIKRNNSVKIFEFEPVVQVSFKILLIWSSGSPPVHLSRTIGAILKEGIVGNIQVKLYEIKTSGSAGDVV